MFKLLNVWPVRFATRSFLIMPTYEYKCEKCGHIFEEYQSISAEPLKNCPEKGCDGTVKRLFSAGAGFLFKGNGFYITDYRSDKYKQSARSDSSSSGKSDSSTSSGK
jgi:putative FmdB family regulatory protein